MNDKRKVSPIVAFREFLENRVGQIRSALPAHISPERFIRVVLTAAAVDPEIIACNRQSLWNACLRACNDGLLPDGIEGAIVAYKGKAQWLPMYQGLLKKFRNSGEFKWIASGIVYDGEEYDHYIDETGEHFRHRPGDNLEGRKIRRVYAIATTKNGGSFIADMPLAEVDRRRAMSRASRDDAPWKQWPEEMMKKTALRALSKLLPKSSDLDTLLRRDEQDLLGIEDRQAIAGRPDAVSALDHFGAEEEEGDDGEPDRKAAAGDNRLQPLQKSPRRGSAADESTTDKEQPPAHPLLGAEGA
jgi:recombination protein RecT